MHCFTRDRFTLEAGQTQEFAYRSDGSGQMIRPNFCSQCGTKVFITVDRYPEVQNAYTATFDEPWELPHGPDSLRYNNWETAMGGTAIPAGFDVFWEHFAPVSGPAPNATVYDQAFLIEKLDHSTGPHTGGCLCGSIRFEFDVDPTLLVICHCDYCKTILGSGISHKCLVAADNFRVSHGSPGSYAHVSAGSGMRVEHRFCGTCGTPVFLTGERFSEVAVFRGALDKPNRIAVTPQNAVQMFLDDALPSGMVIAGIEVHGRQIRRPGNSHRDGTIYDSVWRIGDGPPDN